MESVVEPIRKEHPDVIIESRIVEGHPSPVLIEASRGADLLVVGSRGHWGVRRHAARVGE